MGRVWRLVWDSDGARAGLVGRLYGDRMGFVRGLYEGRMGVA